VGAVAFQIPVPGSTQPIEAQVDDRGRIQLKGYPSGFSATPKQGADVVGFPTTFDAEFCANVRTRAQGAMDAAVPASQRELFRRVVRKPGALTVDLPFATFLLKDLAEAASRAARGAGARSSSFVISNPPRVDPDSIEVTFAPNAISRILGDLTEHQRDLEAGLAASALASQTGSVRIQTSSADFLCDLWAKEATIVVRFGGPGPKSSTTLSGLEPLLP
jgi:hypothetical protein